MIRRPPKSTLFPYTPRFRPADVAEQQRDEQRDAEADDRLADVVDRAGLLEHEHEGQHAGDEQHRRPADLADRPLLDRKSTRLNSSHANISYAVFCLKKNNTS